MKFAEVYNRSLQRPLKYAASDEEKSQLHTIANNLDDNNAAAVYADWLDEFGNRPAMAKVVRLASVKPHGFNYSGKRAIWNNPDYDKVPENGHYHILDVARSGVPLSQDTDSISVEVPHPTDSTKRLAFSARVPKEETSQLMDDLEKEGIPLEQGYESDHKQIKDREVSK